MRLALALFGVLGGVIPATAQDPQASVFLDNLVVTASLEEEKAERLPSSVDVVDSEEIEARQVRSVADVLSTVPSLQVVRSGSPGQVTSLFTRGTESDHTLVLWNGIELNDPYFGGFNWAFLATDGLDRVEVARGPFSSLYGGDALGGVVQLLSRESDGVRIDLEAGEHAYHRAGVSAGARWRDVRFDLAGHVRRGEGEVDNDFFDGEDLSLHAGWRVSPTVEIGLVLRGADAETGIPYSSGSPSPQRRIAWQERIIGVPLTFASGPWKLDAQVSDVSYENAFRDPDDPFGFTASDTRSGALRARAVASYRIDDLGWVAFGSEAERTEVDDRSTFGTNLDDDGQETWATFAEFMRRFGRFGVDLGVRYDSNDVFGSEASPRAGVQFFLTEATRIRASYGEAFRAPSVGELFFPLTGNSELQPEVSSSVEVGIDHHVGSWEVGLAGFENELDNLIDFDFATFRNVNIGSARTRGLEAAFAFRGVRWIARWNATWLDTEDLETGLPLLRRPGEASSLVVSYLRDLWSVTATVRYVGERDDVDPLSFERAVNEDYSKLDVAAQWKVSSWLTPYARVENLTDEEYEEALGFPAPGITLIGGVSLRYP